MPNNVLSFTHTDTGANLYALIWDLQGRVFDVVDSAFETYVTASLANYDVALTEAGTASRRYLLTAPAALPAGSYLVSVYARAGGSPAEGDDLVGEGDLSWDGGNISDPAVASQALAVSESSGLLATEFGDELIQEWVSGEGVYFRDESATVPVTADNQVIRGWKNRFGVILTTVGTMRSQRINGVMTAVGASDQSAAWVVPSSVMVDKRDFAAVVHVQAMNGYLCSLLGLGSDRGVEMGSFNRCNLGTYNATGGTRYSNLNVMASPCLYSLEGTASGLTIRRNSQSSDVSPALPVGIVSGGFVGALNISGVSGYHAAAAYHGIYLMRSFRSAERRKRAFALCGNRTPVKIPSDVSPKVNMGLMGDSNIAGTNATDCCPTVQLLFGSDGTRVVSSAKSAAYFSASGVTLNNADNAAAIDADYLPLAGRNVIVNFETNDPDVGVAATIHAAREAWATARQATGWEYWQALLPHRINGFDWTAYNANVDAVNALAEASTVFDGVIDLYTLFGGASVDTAMYQADHHWSRLAQRRVYDFSKTTVGL